MRLIDMIKENEKFVNIFLGGAFENIKFEYYTYKNTKDIDQTLTCKSKILIDGCYSYITLYFKKIGFYEYVLFNENNFFEMVDLDFDMCQDNIQEIKKIFKIDFKNKLENNLKTKDAPEKRKALKI